VKTLIAGNFKSN